ncbi:hypothetical protein CCR94_12750 [Rhodoblastus sphagnicola]|uniref:Uncharacterized protein n=1 Tax=Rhodoblastus sphagnicola TaxID=333368 RepID=A0A2S6N6F2_9HYPH|nr:hypothetical protein [Rhodoblastus sphagnicola]MBB4197710.1 hypothetical protein [Rhodoblastus sphagnicola]PPQ30191.1 hypothetical protein CCR94_12750 [Rhodoblastus sphagnicola]
MTYLHPPPGDVPVIVTKDVGGYVNEYADMTRLYAETGREVRLHECRSACTLALSLPNVCVYPGSLLKFHKAYNPETKVANDEVSDQLMASYPAAVRERLGDLTRTYKVLTGSELIRLGVRDCNRPSGPAYAVARAKPKPAAPEPGYFSQLAEVFSSATPTATQVKPQRVQVAAVRLNPPKPEAAPPTEAPAAEPPPPVTPDTPPLPPSRPADLSRPAASPQVASPQVVLPQVVLPPPPAPPQAEAPPVAPPPRPPELRITSAWGQRIVGSAPILATRQFTPFPYRVVRKG